MKKLLFIGTYLENFIGGAERSIFTLLSSVSNEYHIEAVTFDNSREQKSHKLNGILIHNYKLKKIFDFKFLNLFLNKFRIKKVLKMYETFDIYISQVFGAAIYLNFINSLFPNAKIIYFLRDETSLNIFKNYEEGFNKFYKKITDLLQFFFILNYKKKNKLMLLNSNKVISNSRFMRNYVKNLFGVDAKLIFPILDIKKFEPRSIKKRDYISMFHSTSHKGINIFLKIAKKLPHEKFCIFGDSPIKIKPSNVKFINWTHDTSFIFKITKLLLVPSIWKEAFSRAPIEAACNFIPTISSNRGGLIESNINGVIISNDITNIEVWLNRIKEIILNYEIYVKKIDFSKIEKFKKEYQIIKFKEVLLNLAG